jgi:cleavage and polyadenylation specificity factor subunit 2
LSAEQSVLIPVLPPTRALDLLILLDNAFATTPTLQPFPIFYLAHTSQKAITATRTMLEWLSQDINLQDSPLDFKYIKIVTQYNDLTQGPPGSRVVIVDDLEFHTNSFAHQAFLDFKSSGHLLLLTSQSISTNSLTHTLLQQWRSVSPTLSSPRPIVNVSLNANIEIEQRIPLQGDELSQWRKTDKANRDLKDAELFFEERQRNLLEGDESDSEEDEEDQLLLDTELQPEQPSQRVRGSTILLQEGTYDFWLGDVEGARSSLKHFPFVDKRKKIDDFGVTFKPDEFVRVEDEVVPVPTRKPKELGGKRKWGEVETDVEDIPARVVKSTTAVNINVRVGYVDLEGLHDGRAAGNLLPRLNARKMVSHRLIRLIVGCGEFFT